MILLDTHTLIWLVEGNKKLGKQALAKIDKALQQQQLFVASISFWETAMLITKNRLELHEPVQRWRKNLITVGLKEFVLNGEIAIHAAELDQFHGDPADRIIVATAIYNSCSLCTADQKILCWNSPLIRIDATK